MSIEVKQKIKEVADDFAMPAKKLIEIVGKFYEKPKSSSQNLSEDQLNVIVDYITQQNQIDSIEQVFAAAAQKKEAPAPAPAQQAKPAAPAQTAQAGNQPRPQGGQSQPRPQQQGNAVGLGQGLDGLPQELPPFVLLGQLLWGGPPVRDDGQVGVIQGKGTLVFFSLTEQVNGGVDRQPVQPGGKRCLPLKGRQPLPSLEESGLGHFFRVVVAPCFAQGRL